MENKIFIKKETMKGIADAIRAKDGTTEEIAVTDMAERIGALNGGYDEGYADGIASVPKYNEFGMINLYSLNVFKEKNPIIDLPNARTLEKFLYVQTIEDVNTVVEHLTVNCSNLITSISGFLDSPGGRYADNTLKKLTLNVDTSKATTWSYAFYVLSAVEEIDGIPIDLSSVTDLNKPLFQNSVAIREARFKGTIEFDIDFAANPLFSKASILSVSSCLSDEVTGKTVTFSQTAVNTAFETSSGAADGSTSTEWAELIATKPNWTISLA